MDSIEGVRDNVVVDNSLFISSTYFDQGHPILNGHFHRISTLKYNWADIWFCEPVIMDREWMVREDETTVVHEELLGEGGYGEVHKVSPPA